MSDSRQRVLVVDDDVDTCHNLSDILADFDYAVDVAHDGKAALQKIQEQSYDVALVDLRMPGMDGITFFQELKRIRPETVAILITAYASQETEREATRRGARQVLAKPVNVARLLPLIEEAVQQPLVLVIDDDAELCDSLWDLLTERGYRVGIATSGEEAAQRLRDVSFRVVLVDMRLPDTEGTAVARYIHETHPEARIVLITGYRNEMQALIEQALTAHADAVCYKPFDVPQLLTDIHRLARPGGSPSA